MPPVIAYGFDLDNTFLKTEQLKWDMARFCHDRFPQVSAQLFTESYLNYRIHNFGRVHMGTILETIAKKAGLNATDSDLLQHQWLITLPYEKYVFPGARGLITGLGPENVYLLTKSQDVEFQREKLALCNLPMIHDPIHERIVEYKDPDIFHNWVGKMKDRGATHLIYGSDEALEIQWAWQAAMDLDMECEGVHHQYGAIWLSGMVETQEALGVHYHPATNFHQFMQSIRDIKHTMEGQPPTIETTDRRGGER